MSKESKDIELVKTVRKYSILCDNLPNHGRQQAVEVAWNAVARETNLSVAEAKKKWRHLKRAFARAQSDPESATGAHYLKDCMPFMLPRGSDKPRTVEEAKAAALARVELPRAPDTEEEHHFMPPEPRHARPQRRAAPPSLPVRELHVHGPGCSQSPLYPHLHPASQLYDRKTFVPWLTQDVVNLPNDQFMYRMWPYWKSLSPQDQKEVQEICMKAKHELLEKRKNAHRD